MNKSSYHHDGFEFSYTDEGEGDIVLVIGGPDYYTKTFSNDLRKKFRFIFLDHRGFAVKKIDKTHLPTMEQLISDIRHFKEHLKLEPFYILGHSGHAYLAMEYAKKLPDHIKGVVVIAAGPDLSVENRKAADTYFTDLADDKRHQLHQKNMGLMQNEIKAHPENEFKIYCTRSAARASFDPQLDVGAFWDSVNINHDIVMHMWVKLFTRKFEIESIKELKCRILIILGLFDFQVPPHFTWNQYRDLFNDVTLKVFPRSGHHPQFEEAQLFENEFLSWITK